MFGKTYYIIIQMPFNTKLELFCEFLRKEKEKIISFPEGL